MAEDPAVRHIIVERDRELEALQRALEGSEVPSALLFVGEPGLGKTHLLRSIRNEGALVLRGYSLEADAPPYFPFRRALARLEREGLPALHPLAQSVLRAAGILTSAGPAPAESPHGDRLAVQDALTELLILVARGQRVVLILDDMQWASAAAWEAITYLVRAAEEAPITLVLASRPEGIEPPGPGAAAISELTRNGLLRLLSLRPLTETGIGSLVTHSLGASPSSRFVSTLAARTGGNPFFLEEVLRSLEESGQLTTARAGLELADERATIAVPGTLRLAIWQRVSRLPEASVEALQAGSVLGRVFSLDIVAGMLGQPPQWVAGWLKPAARARIVAEDSPGRWAFLHDTLRDAVFEQLGDRRAELHRAAAGALTETHDQPRTLETEAALAYHLREAGDAPGAMAASLRASELALAAHAADEALQFAVTAAALYETAPADPSLGPAIYRALAVAADTAADYQGAERAWSSLLDLADNDAERARVLVSLATAARKGERSDAAAAYFERALRLLDAGDDTRTLVEALVELSTLEGTTRSEYGPAIEHGERALHLARTAGDAALEARAALALANARARAETPVSARPLLALALEKALEANDLVAAAEASASLSNAYYWTGELREALVFAERRLEIAERGRDAFALRHAYSWLAMLATSKGDWDRARAMVQLAEPAIARMGSPEPLGFLRVVEALLALRTNDTERALAKSEEAMRILTPLGEATVSWYVAIRLLALVHAGRTTEAARECEQQEIRLRTMPDNALPARSSRCGLGRVYVALGDRDRAALCETKLAPFADDFHWRPARLTLAGIAALRGDRARALELMREVEALEARNGLDFDLQDTRRVIRLLEDGAPAETAFGPARDSRASALPGGSLRGLSPRELEVLQLVAEGLTNRDIADRLVLSERTVINHVSHIFEKIDVDNRAAATAFAFRSGLVRRE